MVGKIINGKELSADIRSRVAMAVQDLRHEHDIQPGLAVVLVGEHSASQVYVRNKVIQTEAVGMNSVKHAVDQSISETRLLTLIDELNNDPQIHGILVQLPLPAHIDANVLINAIDPTKDVDGFTVNNAGLLATGQNAMIPCTPLGCLFMLQSHHASLSGMNAVVVGRSNIVGKPMANLLLRENCTVTVVHSRTKRVASVCANADILVAAVGLPKFIQGGWIKEGATVIDVGINRIPAPEKGIGKSRLVGDVDFDAAIKQCGAITPVPGGVGPMTIACLLMNTLKACIQINDLEFPTDLIA